MAIIKLSVSEQRRLSVFFTCLLLALIAWVFAMLSGTYSFTVKQTITFKNVPQRRAFRTLQPDTVEATMQGTGWQMVFSHVADEKQPVTIDLHTLEQKDFIALNTQISQINKTRDATHKILSFEPDTLYFDFTNRMVKKIRVEPVFNINYQPQYAISGKITIKPAYVTLNGPGNVIEKISTWKTDTLTLNGVNELIKGTLQLQAVKEGNISVYPKSVQVQIPVEEFTEKTLKISVRLINNPHYYNVKIFPQHISVTFTTPLSRYTELDENFFEATVDLKLWEEGYTVLPVNITRMPAYCKIVNITPRNIDFLVKK
ncbi:CdaR family protein [Mucilaginibacter terrae]|uniref:YbbR-like domain-containing protein n=1 Tax=Mucilaginibacter terrae TaxID=1955052 RepID=UPI00363AC807